MAKKTPPTKTPSTPDQPKPKAAKKKGKPAAGAKDAVPVKAKTTSVAPADGLMPPPTEAQMESLQGYPELTAADVAHYLKANEGYQVVAQETLGEWQDLGSQFAVPGLSPETLAQALATRAALSPIERALEPYYQRAYYNRLKADSDAIGVLFALARAIKGTGNSALAKRFAPLITWIAATHTPRKPAPKKKPVKPTNTPTNGGTKG
jgi:hypothetical protein